MSQDCFLNSKDGKNCGSSRGLSGLVRLSECNDEVKHHLISGFAIGTAIRWGSFGEVQR